MYTETSYPEKQVASVSKIGYFDKQKLLLHKSLWPLDGDTFYM